MLSHIPYMSPMAGFARGTDRFYFAHSGAIPTELNIGILMAFSFRLLREYLDRHATYKVVPEMLNAQALRIIKNLCGSEKPFFLYIHHDAHHPFLSQRKISSLTDFTSMKSQYRKRVEISTMKADTKTIFVGRRPGSRVCRGFRQQYRRISMRV